MKTKKGFTLVELLAVIVILAILVILAVPNVIKMLDRSRKNVFSVEAESIIKSAKNAYSQRELLGETKKTCFSLQDLADYVDKNFTGYTGSVQINPDTNTYKIWLAKDKMAVNGSASGNIEVMDLSDDIHASMNCEDMIIQACSNSLNGKLLIIDINGGEWNGYNTTQVFPMDDGETRIISDPVKEDYNFLGWEFNGDAGSFDDATNTFTMGDDNVILEANWDLATRELFISTDGGIISRSLTDSIAPGQSTTIPHPTKARYNFVRWEITGADSYFDPIDDTRFIMGSENTTILAIWELATRELTINLNNGLMDGAILREIAPGNKTIVNNPTKANHIFGGWTISSPTTVMNGTELIMGTVDTTITANWFTNCTLALTGTKPIATSEFYTSNVTVNFTNSYSNYYTVGLDTAQRSTNGLTTQTQTQDTAGTIYYGYVLAPNGNSGSCQITVKKDTTNPSCTISASGTTLTVTGSDISPMTYSWTSKTSGYSSTRTKTGNQYTNSWKAWVKDELGHIGACSFTCGAWVDGASWGGCVSSEWGTDGITAHTALAGGCEWWDSNGRYYNEYKRYERSRTCTSAPATP